MGPSPVKGVTNTGTVRSERLTVPGYFLTIYIKLGILLLLSRKGVYAARKRRWETGAFFVVENRI